MNPKDLLIGEGDGAIQSFLTFLGIQKERFVCPKCNEHDTKAASTPQRVRLKASVIHVFDHSVVASTPQRVRLKAAICDE